MAETKQGQSVENPVALTGDFYSIINTLIEEGVNVYFVLNESTLFLDLSDMSLRLETVSSVEQLVILSAIAQSIALAQRFKLTPSVNEELLSARFRHITGEVEYEST